MNEDNKTAYFAMLDGMVKSVKDAFEEGRNVEIDIRGGLIETEPADNCVTRKATGERMYQIFIGPSRWKATA